MYKDSIKKNSKYLVPFVEGIKLSGSDEIFMNSGTMIIVNSDGWLLTCKHIANEFIANNELNKKYSEMMFDKNKRIDIVKKYNLFKGTPVLSNICFPFKVPENFNVNVIASNTLDVALIKIDGVHFDLDSYPIFSKKLPETGQSVCKLGYAFPEADIYEYKDNTLKIKNKQILSFPLFPMDGIVTRHVVDGEGTVIGIETSTPGLRGQSGGPLFNPQGLIYGIQSITTQMDIEFDIDMDVKRGLDYKHVNQSQFINLGISIPTTEIIKMMDKNDITYRSK